MLKCLYTLGSGEAAFFLLLLPRLLTRHAAFSRRRLGRQRQPLSVVRLGRRRLGLGKLD